MATQASESTNSRAQALTPALTSGTVVSGDGTRVAYDASGSGTPLVVVAGALGFKDFSYMRKLAGELAKDFRVYSYDRRGRGDSTDAKPYSIDKEIADLAAVCREAGGRPVVLGISSGAALALEAAASGVPMSHLVAFEPPYMVGTHRRPEHARYEDEVTRLIATNDRDGAVGLFMRTVGVPRPVLAIMRLFPFWKAFRRVAHTLPYDAAVMRRFELPTVRLGAIRVPTLVVGGAKSPPSLRDAVRAVAEAIPRAQLEMLAKQSHAVKPSALSPVVHRFVGR